MKFSVKNKIRAYKNKSGHDFLEPHPEKRIDFRYKLPEIFSAIKFLL